MTQFFKATATIEEIEGFIVSDSLSWYIYVNDGEETRETEVSFNEDRSFFIEGDQGKWSLEGETIILYHPYIGDEEIKIELRQNGPNLRGFTDTVFVKLYFNLRQSTLSGGLGASVDGSKIGDILSERLKEFADSIDLSEIATIVAGEAINQIQSSIDDITRAIGGNVTDIKEIARKLNVVETSIESSTSIEGVLESLRKAIAEGKIDLARLGLQPIEDDSASYFEGETTFDSTSDIKTYGVDSNGGLVQDGTSLVGDRYKLSPRADGIYITAYSNSWKDAVIFKNLQAPSDSIFQMVVGFSGDSSTRFLRSFVGLADPKVDVNSWDMGNSYSDYMDVSEWFYAAKNRDGFYKAYFKDNKSIDHANYYLEAGSFYRLTFSRPGTDNASLTMEQVNPLNMWGSGFNPLTLDVHKVQSDVLAPTFSIKNHQNTELILKGVRVIS